MSVGTRPTGWPGEPVEPPGVADAQRAAERLEGTVVRTPVLSLRDSDDILLKPEVLQPIGSFKVRGVGNWALALDPGSAERADDEIRFGNLRALR